MPSIAGICALRATIANKISSNVWCCNWHCKQMACLCQCCAGWELTCLHAPSLRVKHRALGNKWGNWSGAVCRKPSARIWSRLSKAVICMSNPRAGSLLWCRSSIWLKDGCAKQTPCWFGCNKALFGMPRFVPLAVMQWPKLSVGRPARFVACAWPCTGCRVGFGKTPAGQRLDQPILRPYGGMACADGANDLRGRRCSL